MIRNTIILLILFLQHESFYLLPKEILIAPGVFRMFDASLLVAPFFILSIPRTISRYREESLLVISFLLIMLIGCFSASVFFPQTYVDGLLNIRKNFAWANFFVYIVLIRNIADVEKLVRLMTFLTGVYVLILLITKFVPSLGIIHLPVGVYDSTSTLVRFGEFRLFFPYGNIPLMFFFIAISQSMSDNIDEKFVLKAMRLFFICIVSYAVIASMTRAVIYPVLATAAFAFIISKNFSYKLIGISVAVLLISFQLISTGINSNEPSFLEDTLLGKMVLRAGDLSPEDGRKFQANMYFKQFERSPLFGVGNFAIGKYAKYEDGIQRTIMEFGFFNGADLGYLKILGEYGLIGIAWVMWWFSYFYRRSKQILTTSQKTGWDPFAVFFARGMLMFNFYLLISGVTLGHWVHHNVLTILPLSLALMAVASVSLRETNNL